MPVEIRPFRRGDREQLTALVNAHAAAVVPGLAVSVNAVMSQLEGEPGEFIVDPWVTERATLVAEQRGRVVAAAHLLRYADEERVGGSYRGAGEVRWCVFWPDAPFWPDASEAAASLLDACVRLLERWGVSRQYADGSLPAPAVYGVPEQWPHVRSAYERAGFLHSGRVEIVLLAEVGALLSQARAPLPGLAVRRTVGVNGTRLSAVLGGEVAGFVEVEEQLEPGRLPRRHGLADVGNLEVAAGHRAKGLEDWLLAQAADWLGLTGVDRVLAYARPGDGDGDCDGEGAFFAGHPAFRELTRTLRGWERRPAVGGATRER